MSTHVTTSRTGTWKHRSTVAKALSGLTVCTGAACLAVLGAATPANAGVPPEPTWSVPEPLPGPPEPSIPVQPSGGLDANSVALGALGGIALGGAGLGITLGVQRRRDHSALHST
ncbi:hypothetical protein ACGFIF_16950 [Kribbella sp. NPDC049174]|uniref:hypothetical protein n=1 Tax=Kribbella sp. NPDC049174 TaxID=3364112 RepID=UPI00371B7942